MPILPKRAVRKLPPYPKPEEGRHAFVRLDFNENTSGFPAAYPPGLPHQAVSAYPEYGRLIDRVSDFYKVSREQVLLTNGSDEGLFIVAHTFIEPGESKAVVSTHPASSSSHTASSWLELTFRKCQCAVICPLISTASSPLSREACR